MRYLMNFRITDASGLIDGNGDQVNNKLVDAIDVNGDWAITINSSTCLYTGYLENVFGKSVYIGTTLNGRARR